MLLISIRVFQFAKAFMRYISMNNYEILPQLQNTLKVINDTGAKEFRIGLSSWKQYTEFLNMIIADAYDPPLY